MTKRRARSTRLATGAQREVLELVGDPNMSPETVARIQQALVESGGLAELEQHISDLTESAVTSLDAAPITEVAKTELVQLADYVSQRTVW